MCGTFQFVALVPAWGHYRAMESAQLMASFIMPLASQCAGCRSVLSQDTAAMWDVLVSRTQTRLSTKLSQSISRHQSATALRHSSEQLLLYIRCVCFPYLSMEATGRGGRTGGTAEQHRKEKERHILIRNRTTTECV